MPAPDVGAHRCAVTQVFAQQVKPVFQTVVIQQPRLMDEELLEFKSKCRETHEASRVIMSRQNS